MVPWDPARAALTVTDGKETDLSGTRVSAEQVHFTGVEALEKNASMTLLDASKAGEENRPSPGNIAKDSR